jgi:hypothetical protein
MSDVANFVKYRPFFGAFYTTGTQALEKHYPRSYTNAFRIRGFQEWRLLPESIDPGKR